MRSKLEVVPQTDFFLMLVRLDISSGEYLSKWAATAFEVGHEEGNAKVHPD